MSVCGKGRFASSVLFDGLGKCKLGLGLPSLLRALGRFHL
jgi:hypothetical protein